MNFGNLELLTVEPAIQGSLTVADAVWIAAAVAQRAGGPGYTFSTAELAAVVTISGLTKGQERSVILHVNQHCVANRKAQPNRLRYLTATADGYRRLWRLGDGWDPTRDEAPTHPAWDKIPEGFADLRHWYEHEWNGMDARIERDPLIDAIGSGRHIWADEHADEYVARLRENWGSSQ